MRAQFEELHTQVGQLHNQLQKTQRELTASREATRHRVRELRQELSRSRALSDALRATRLKSMCANEPVTADEYGGRQELALVANHMSDGLVLLAVEPDGVYRPVFLNPAAERLFGRPAGPRSGRPLDRNWNPAAEPAWKAKLDEVAQSRQSLGFESDGPAGTVLEIRMEPVLGEDGECSHVLTLARDMTQRRQAEQAMEQARVAAERANQAKDRFLAVLSHELRTPLTPVLAAASILRSDHRLDADLREQMEMIRRNVDLEARLISDLLDLTRIAHGKIEIKKEQVDFCMILRRAVEICRPDIETRRLHLRADLDLTQPCWVEADATRLQQVFWNLLKNAVKFTPPGGHLGIRCWIEESKGVAQRPEAEPPSHSPRSWVTAEVRDNGIGIAPGAMGRIFREFEQGELSKSRQFGGLGLGLSISKALVELHGGTIEAHSEGLDKGSTFIVRLPIANHQAPAPPSDDSPGGLEADRSHSTPADRSIRVLLVEDHGDTAMIMQRLLTRWGYRVQTAGDVDTALELAARDDFDLLVSDLGLPDRSGVELVRELRARGKTYPAIALSGYGLEEDISRSKAAGFNEHLVKPVDFTEFYQVVGRYTLQD